MRVAINLLTDHPDAPSGAHFFWTHMIPEMASLLTDDEELHLVVSPRSRPMHEGYGDRVKYITYPWSNEHQKLRTLSEQIYSPVRLRLGGIDVFNTLIAPLVKPAPALVAHFKTMHAFVTPESLRPAARRYRQFSYPRTAKMADAIIINSDSLRSEVERYLDVEPAKLRLIREAVDHDLFRLRDPDEARQILKNKYGVTGPFVLFVSSLWQYKNCDGLMRAFAQAGKDLGNHQLVIVGSGRDTQYVAELHALSTELGIDDRVVWIGGVALEDTVPFYTAADAFVYPSFSETFGLPLLEAMACGCPVVTSDCSAMPETTGGAALLANPEDPAALAKAIVAACGDSNQALRKLGVERAAMFTWATTAAQTVEVYREVYRRREDRR